MKEGLEFLAGKLFVVVDDNRTFTGLMRSMLAEIGVRDVVDFASAEGVLDFVKLHHVDLMFSDLVMPRVNGFQLAHQIRHSAEVINHVMPIILVTGHADSRNILTAIKAGFDEVLVKPARPRDVYDKIVKALTNPRVYIKTRSGYFGPDRRRRQDPLYSGPERRKAKDHEVLTFNGLKHVNEVKPSDWEQFRDSGRTTVAARLDAARIEAGRSRRLSDVAKASAAFAAPVDGWMDEVMASAERISVARAAEATLPPTVTALQDLVAAAAKARSFGPAGPGSSGSGSSGPGSSGSGSFGAGQEQASRDEDAVSGSLSAAKTTSQTKTGEEDVEPLIRPRMRPVSPNRFYLD